MQAVADSRHASNKRTTAQPKAEAGADAAGAGVNPSRKKQRWSYDEHTCRWHCNAPILTIGTWGTDGDGEEWWRGVESQMKLGIGANAVENKPHTLHADVQQFALDEFDSGSEGDATPAADALVAGSRRRNGPKPHHGSAEERSHREL